MNALQLNAFIDLVSYLKKKYSITDIKRHKDVNATNCPGTYFPFSTIITSNHIVQEDTWLQRLNKEIKRQGFSFYPTVKKKPAEKLQNLFKNALIL